MRTAPEARSAAGGEDDLGAVRAHDLAALDGERFGHEGDEWIAARSADHRERDAGVARGRLDDGLPRLELAAPLGVLDDAEGEAVLDRAARVGGLELDVELDVRGAQAVDAHDRRAPDGFRDVVVNHNSSYGIIAATGSLA
ncbi:MAG TPA: hypothetical protein VLM79_13455 [Kofleriaceae bacterium]|nr:hypothetical protein [Kofleriaceae bacterium]